LSLSPVNGVGVAGLGLLMSPSVILPGCPALPLDGLLRPPPPPPSGGPPGGPPPGCSGDLPLKGLLEGVLGALLNGFLVGVPDSPDGLLPPAPVEVSSVTVVMDALRAGAFPFNASLPIPAEMERLSLWVAAEISDLILGEYPGPRSPAANALCVIIAIVC
jgi:hypothetical protein